MTVNGRKIVVLEKDDQGKPDLAKSLLAQAYGDDKVDLAVGPSSSGVALAMLPVAEEYKKILLVEPAVADSDHRRQVEPLHLPHRRATPRRTRSPTRWRSASGVSRSPRWRRTMPSAATASPPFKDALEATKSKAKIVFEEYVPQDTTDFTAARSASSTR